PEQTLAQVFRHRDSPHGPADVVVEPALVLGDAAALGAVGQVAFQGLGLTGVQFRPLGTGKVQKETGVFTIHRSPSAGLRPVLPRPAGVAGCGGGPWPVPDATSRYRSAGPSARRCRDN